MQAIVIVNNLYGVVGQVHGNLRERVQRVLVARHPDVPLVEQIAVEVLGHKDPEPNIKLAALDEQWLFDILLNYKEFVFKRFDDEFELRQVLKDSDASPPVTSIWFQDPNVLARVHAAIDLQFFWQFMVYSTDILVAFDQVEQIHELFI